VLLLRLCAVLSGAENWGAITQPLGGRSEHFRPIPAIFLGRALGVPVSVKIG